MSAYRSSIPSPESFGSYDSTIPLRERQILDTAEPPRAKPRTIEKTLLLLREFVAAQGGHTGEFSGDIIETRKRPDGSKLNIRWNISDPLREGIPRAVVLTSTGQREERHELDDQTTITRKKRLYESYHIFERHLDSGIEYEMRRYVDAFEFKEGEGKSVPPEFDRIRKPVDDGGDPTPLAEEIRDEQWEHIERAKAEAARDREKADAEGRSRVSEVEARALLKDLKASEKIPQAVSEIPKEF